MSPHLYTTFQVCAFIGHVREAENSPRKRSLSVLLVTNLFHPVDNLTVEFS